ncbi:hypothetical protein Pcinc_012027 [Petrolisthes cinctipes]|uniref:Uncharacterized protein n=1 Tax=Petrolisthes cinctipes TaxID=88211 RepID=A0AAE1G5N1_PETCI|nr:hypothetical protein Pcinc_012027 [Petrolisthes cinctipes]
MLGFKVRDTAGMGEKQRREALEGDTQGQLGRSKEERAKILYNPNAKREKSFEKLRNVTDRGKRGGERERGEKSWEGREGKREKNGKEKGQETEEESKRKRAKGGGGEVQTEGMEMERGDSGEEDTE